MDINQKVGEKIRNLREENGHSLTELAKRLSIDKSYLSKIERNKEDKSPNIELLQKIADIYGVHITYFFGEAQEVSNDLKNVGVEWVAFINELQNEYMTPEDTKRLLEFAKRIKNDAEKI